MRSADLVSWCRQPRWQMTRELERHIARLETKACSHARALSVEGWQADMVLREAYATTRLEGTHLSQTEAMGLRRGETIASDRPDDARELLQAVMMVEQVQRANWHQQPVTESAICELHRGMVNGIRDDEAKPGVYRHVQNRVVDGATGAIVWVPPPHKQVSTCMAALVDWMGSVDEVPAFVRAAIGKLALLLIHPFVDGNGRTARLIYLWILRQNGWAQLEHIAPSEALLQDTQAYYASLNAVRDAELDASPWLMFAVTRLEAQLEA